jgi:hypothetical protein
VAQVRLVSGGLKTKLSILKERDLVLTVPWKGVPRAAFEKAYRDEKDRVEKARKRAMAHFAVTNTVASDAKKIADAKAGRSGIDPFYLTREILVDPVNRERDKEFIERHPDVGVRAVVAYPSHAAFSEEVPIKVVDPTEADHRDQLAGVFGWEFFVPEDASCSDEDLLAHAADLSLKKSFRKARRDFREWQDKLLQYRASPQQVRAGMERMIERYRDETAKARVKTMLTHGFAIAGSLTSIAGTLLVFPPLSVAGGFIALASIGVKWLPGQGPGPDARPAAMFADARKHFGWRSAG